VSRPIAVNSLREHMDSTANTGNDHDVNSVNTASGTDRKAYRRQWMRDWRERQRDKAQLERQAADNNQANNQIDPELNSEISKSENIAEPELKSEQAELRPEPNVGEPITADEYERKVIPEADKVTRALKARLTEIDKSQELNRQRQAQAEQLALAQQLFHIWKKEGLDENEERFLLANGPEVIIGLSNYAASEASRLGHQAWSPEHIEAAKKVFHENVAHLEAQARANASHQQPSEPEPMSAIPATPTLPFFQTPAASPRRQEPPRRSKSIVSAPVNRESGLLSDNFDRKQQHTLSAQEVEAARISGVTPAEYLKQKLKYQMLKSQGQVE
jgi:hypothetical protein